MHDAVTKAENFVRSALTAISRGKPVEEATVRAVAKKVLKCLPHPPKTRKRVAN